MDTEQLVELKDHLEIHLKNETNKDYVPSIDPKEYPEERILYC